MSYRRFRKLINKPEDNQDYRKLATVDCKTEVEIKEYLKDKSIVVFTTESFVDEDNEYEVNQNGLISYLVPIAEKKLDFKFHKELSTQI